MDASTVELSVQDHLILLSFLPIYIGFEAVQSSDVVCSHLSE